MSSIEYFRERAKINKHALDEEVADQPELCWQVSRELARAEQQLDNARRTRKATRGRLVQQAFSGSVEKKTEFAITAWVDSQPEYITDAQTEAELQREVTEWQGLRDAFVAKGFALKEIVALFLADYFVSDQVVGDPAAHTARFTSEQEVEEIRKEQKSKRERPRLKS